MSLHGQTKVGVFFKTRIYQKSYLFDVPSNKLHARTNEFSLAPYLRLGVALSFTNWIKKCDYGHDLYEYGYHFLTWGWTCVVSQFSLEWVE